MSRDQGSRLLPRHVPAGFVLCVGKQSPPALGRRGSQVQEAGLGPQLPEQHCWPQPDRFFFSLSLAQGLQMPLSAHLIRDVF